MEAEGDEKNRPQEGIGDSVKPVLHFLNQDLVGHLLPEEKTGHVGPQDNVESNRLGEQAEGKAEDEDEGEALSLTMPEGMAKKGVEPPPP